MLTKGTKEYNEASELAKKIERYSSFHIQFNSSMYKIAFNDLGYFISQIQKLNVFASQIATTIDNQMMSAHNGETVARISSKQAWILACAAIESNITLK
jgi:hypothetical protein